MKWPSLLVATSLLFCAALRAQDPTFTQKLTPEEFRGAGLDKLTPAERAELDQLVAGTKTVTKTVVKEVVKEVPAAPAADPTPASVAARATESHSAAEAGGWLNWLRPKAKTQTETVKAPELVIVAHIVGKFYGWDAHTRFHLDNGQVWAVSDGTAFNLTRPQTDPEVRITPQTIFGFLLEIPSADAQTRVRPIN